MPLDWKTPDMAQVGESYSDILSASRLNQVPKAIDAIIKTVNDLQPNTTGDVTRFVYWTGEIVAKGPDGDADYTDSRYWVKMLAAKAYSGTGGTSGKGRNAKVDFQDEKTPGVGGIFTVTSIKEVKAQTHTLAIGQRVEVFLAWNSKGTPYLFMSESSEMFVVQVTGNATCGGVYTCRAWMRPAAGADISVSGSTFSAATLGRDPGADDGYLFNLPETGKTTHDLTAAANSGNAKLVIAMLWFTNSDKKRIYLGIQMYPGC